MPLLKCKNCGAEKPIAFLPTTTTGFLIIPGGISGLWAWISVTQQTHYPLSPLARTVAAVIAALAAFFLTAYLLERFLSMIEWFWLKRIVCHRCGQKDWMFSDMRQWGS